MTDARALLDFTLSPPTQWCHCCGRSAHSDVIAFLMQSGKLSFWLEFVHCLPVYRAPELLLGGQFHLFGELLTRTKRLVGAAKCCIYDSCVGAVNWAPMTDAHLT